MYLIPFYVIEPELAERETRTLTLFKPQDDLPEGSYGILEFYCPDPDCDCRRVMLNVAEEKQPNRFLASISYGFDRDDEMAGPFLDPLNPQSEHAFKLLEMVSGLVLSDRRYLKRLERHYRLVKKAAVDPSHPAYDKIHKVMNEEVTEVSLPQRSTGEQVGRNDPCPCGSGKKYKYCCMLKAR